MTWRFLEQGHAEDVLMHYSYHYYVLGKPLISDAEFDAFMGSVREQWSVSYASHVVGSSSASDYPLYVREGRRPNALERVERDKKILQRWLDVL